MFGVVGEPMKGISSPRYSLQEWLPRVKFKGVGEPTWFNRF